MSLLFWALIGVSFAGAFAIGFFTRRFISLIFSLSFGAGIGAFSFWLFLVSPSAHTVGLGIIAVAPVMIILFGAFNIFAALFGGIIGILIGKKRRKQAHE
ncbi:MAG: hypothetical protein Q7R73_04395 [bacterium]|nr:hypothetical protein [bacterium]